MIVWMAGRKGWHWVGEDGNERTVSGVQANIPRVAAMGVLRIENGLQCL